MEESLEIKKIIEKNRSFLLCVNPKKTDSFDLNLSSSVLFYTLKKIGKVVKLYPQDLEFKNPFFPFSLKELTSTVFISKNSNLLSEIYYKKQNDLIELCFLSKNTFFNLNKLPLEEGKKKVGVIITLGIPSLEILEDFYEKNFKIFFSLPIINIDSDLSNREYGKINFIEEKPFSFLVSKILFEISKKAIDEYIAKSLFYGILSSLEKKRLEKRIIEILVSLKRKISEFSEISQRLLKEFSEKEKLLFETFIKFLEYDKKASLPIITIPKKELSFSSLEEKDLPRGISLFRGRMWTLSPILFLWESHASTQGILYSSLLQHLEKISHVLEGTIRKGRFFFISKKSPQITKSLILKAFYG